MGQRCRNIDHSQNFCPHRPEKNKDDGGTPVLAHTLSGNHSGQEALRWEQLESNHRENRATGKEGETDQMSQAQPSEKKKWLYACGLFGMNDEEP
jgi:hypothetical protein